MSKVPKMHMIMTNVGLNGPKIRTNCTNMVWNGQNLKYFPHEGSQFKSYHDINDLIYIMPSTKKLCTIHNLWNFWKTLKFQRFFSLKRLKLKGPYFKIFSISLNYKYNIITKFFNSIPTADCKLSLRS